MYKNTALFHNIFWRFLVSINFFFDKFCLFLCKQNLNKKQYNVVLYFIIYKNRNIVRSFNYVDKSHVSKSNHKFW